MGSRCGFERATWETFVVVELTSHGFPFWERLCVLCLDCGSDHTCGIKLNAHTERSACKTDEIGTKSKDCINVSVPLTLYYSYTGCYLWGDGPKDICIISYNST